MSLTMKMYFTFILYLKILSRKDIRTSIMIRNIPNKYTVKTLMEDLDFEFKGKYDIFYLPIDYFNNCNLGFAFINFVDSFHILKFDEVFKAKKWKRFNSTKVKNIIVYLKDL